MPPVHGSDDDDTNTPRVLLKPSDSTATCTSTSTATMREARLNLMVQLMAHMDELSFLLAEMQDLEGDLASIEIVFTHFSDIALIVNGFIDGNQAELKALLDENTSFFIQKLKAFITTLLELNVRLDERDQVRALLREPMLHLELLRLTGQSILRLLNPEDFAQTRKNSRIQYYNQLIAYYHGMLQDYEEDDAKIWYLNKRIHRAQAERRLIMDQSLAPARLGAQAPQQRTHPRKRGRAEASLIEGIIHRSRKARALGSNDGRGIIFAQNPIDEDEAPRAIITTTATTTTTTPTDQEARTLADYLDALVPGGSRFSAQDL
ncbi:MAG TPA: hypothetical protein PLV25_06275 [Opitutales bacterium]|nr:hypothetical protein [Opitutales bacterium]